MQRQKRLELSVDWIKRVHQPESENAHMQEELKSRNQKGTEEFRIDSRYRTQSGKFMLRLSGVGFVNLLLGEMQMCCLPAESNGGRAWMVQLRSLCS